MAEMALIGENEKHQPKFERPLFFGSRDILIMQYDAGLTSQEEVDDILKNFQEALADMQDEEGNNVPLLLIPDHIKLKVLRFAAD